MDSKHVELVATPSYETLPVYTEVTADQAHLPTYSAPIASTSADTLLVPTAGPNLSSGFPYDTSLSEFNVGPAEWSIFIQELQKVAAATLCQKTLAILSGLATAAVIIDPWTSSCVTRYVWNKQVEKNVVRGLKPDDNDDGCCKPKETVGTVLKRWNDKWSESGVAVTLDVGKVFAKADEEGMVVKTPIEQEQRGCRTRKCHKSKRGCGASGSCASRRACGAKEGCRRTCGKNVVSFRLAVRKTKDIKAPKIENELSEKNNA